MKKFTLFTLVLGALLACQSIRIEKRRYRPGFHFSWNHQSHSKDDTQLRKLEKSTSQFQKTNELSSLTTQPKKEDSWSVNSSKKEEEGSTAVIQTETQAKDESATITSLNSNSEQEKTTNSKISSESNLQNKKEDTREFSAWWSLILLAIFPSFILGRKRKEAIAYWASRNKRKSQALLVGIAIIGFMACFSLGILLRISFSPYMLAIPIITGIGALILNHKREKGVEGLSKRQLSFGLVNTNAFLTALYIGNQAKHYFSLPDEGVSTGAAIALSVFLIIAAIIAFLGLLILSCDLACSGYVALSYTVLLAGTFILIFFVTYTISYLFNKNQVPTLILIRRALIIAAIPTILLAIFLFLQYFM